MTVSDLDPPLIDIDQAIACGDGLSEEDPGLLSPDAAPVVAGLPVPIGADAASVSHWFDGVVEIVAPMLDGSLAAEREAAEAYARMAKADNTRRAYRAAVRAWCAWCAKRDLPPLPGSGADVAAFLASERGRGLTPRNVETAPRRDPLSAPCRRLRRPHRRCCGLGNAIRYPPASCPTGGDAAQEGRGNRWYPAPDLGTYPRRSARATGPRDSSDRLCRRLAALGAGTDPGRAVGKNRTRHAADPPPNERLPDSRRYRAPALRAHRTLSCACDHSLVGGCGNCVRPRVPASLAAKAGAVGRAPSPAPSRRLRDYPMGSF